jgi:hypothetical protein
VNWASPYPILSRFLVEQLFIRGDNQINKQASPFSLPTRRI